MTPAASQEHRADLTDRSDQPGKDDYTRAMLNILEDMTDEKERLEETQRAMVNILEDASREKTLLEETQKAVLNIMEDASEEKTLLEGMQKAVINILEDFTGEKERSDETQRAILNILDDFTGEKERLEDNQRAMLNLLEDFDVERERTEAINLELREAFESLRRAKEAADAANRELEAFSYSVSHDLRAPLRAIDGFSLALLNDYRNLLDERGEDYLRRVRGATQRMAQLIDDLLKLSRLTRGELTIGEVNLSALAQGVTAELRKTQPERRVSFRIATGLSAICDPHLLKVVLENLLGNAWKFTGRKEGATIEFGVTEAGGVNAYFVRDNGAGFDMTYADKLFVTFQRLHLEKEYPGTGIGLSLVQRIIRRHGGTVWAEGKVGQGATFYFTLPSDSKGEG
ncbi:MAG: PAS domain-containing sensor histidine kinase [Deltaproteobacteria bacterium]|nr:PAS domain-containing sensor histidine kinase [Deltaproteobacteria bacterium]